MVLIKTSGEVRFPTKRSAMRLGNDDGYCIRPLKVSPGLHRLISYALENPSKAGSAKQGVLIIYFVQTRMKRQQFSIWSAFFGQCLDFVFLGYF